MAIEDKQRLTQGQQIHHQGKQIAKPSHPMWQQKHYKATHFLKLPAPPPLLPMTHQPIGAGYPHYFQFSEPYVEPMDSKNHFLNEPPPPAPLNHVYETIKERSPISPPLPDHLQTINNTLPPPLPPSRLLKKKITQASSNQSRSHKTHRKSSTEKEAEKKGYSKMFALQPPAYIAPPALLISTNNSNTQGSTKQYNLQQRTKADGEQKSYIYQQLKEQKQQQQQQQQQQPQPQQKSNTLQSEVHEKLIKNPNMMQQKPSQQGMREHPVGANGEIKFPLISNEVLNNSNSNSNSNTNTNISNANNNSFVNDMTTATTMMTTMMMDGNEDCCQQFSVEHTLQQAGLLHNTNTVSGSIAGSTAVANGANNTNVRYQRPSALPIVFEEEAGEFQDVLVLEEDGTAKLPYRHGKIEVSLETAQAMAAAAYYAR
uniref:Uncharacterized protein n=1 Tax=Glossina pallidipes TaxID=7398 RepID=A0A1B0AIV4_GLOPL